MVSPSPQPHLCPEPTCSLHTRALFKIANRNQSCHCCSRQSLSNTPGARQQPFLGVQGLPCHLQVAGKGCCLLHTKENQNTTQDTFEIYCQCAAKISFFQGEKTNTHHVILLAEQSNIFVLWGGATFYSHCCSFLFIALNNC